MLIFVKFKGAEVTVGPFYLQEKQNLFPIQTVKFPRLYLPDITYVLITS